MNYKKTIRFLMVINFIFLGLEDTCSQQKPVLSQYMFNGLVLNPAYTGVHEHLNVTFLYRDQWVNLEGAPVTQTLTAHSGIKGKRIGVGFMAVNDQIGIHSDVGFYGSYAYRIRMSSGTLSMGLQAGMNNLKSDYTLLDLRHEDDPLLSGVTSNMKVNFGTGLYFHNKTSYVGFSVPYIRKRRTIRDDDFMRNLEESRYYYLTAGKVLDLTQKVKIKPSGLLRFEEGMPVAYDFNLNFYLEDVLNVGGSYRSGDSFITLFELKLNDFIRFGYAFDWVISDINNYTRGTHEFMLNYRINLYAPRKHRMCPGPYYF